MKTLDFKLREYSRFIFPNLRLKTEWEEKLSKARKISKELEYLSVVHNIRKFALVLVDSDRYEEEVDEYSKLGLEFTPVTKMSKSKGFIHNTSEPKEGDSFLWMGAVYKKESEELVSSLTKALDEKDDDKVGECLGYPKCCRNFYSRTISDNIFDPVWQQAENTQSEYVKIKQEHRILISNKTDKYASAMPRVLGVRLSPHIACSHDCEESAELNKAMHELAEELELEGLKELDEILSMPMEWDCLKGIAYISTPVFKVEYSSVACYPNYIVQKEGTFFPDDAPSGLKFPWTERWKINGSLIEQMKKAGKL